MNNDLEQLRINRVKMRAEITAFFYTNVKRVLKSMNQDNRLVIRTVVPVPAEIRGLKPINKCSRNIQAGMTTHYDKRLASISEIVIWVKINSSYIK